MKVTRGEKTSDGGSDGKTEETKAISRRKSKQESEKEAQVEKNKHRRDASYSSEEKYDVEEKREKEKGANGKYDGRKRRDDSHSRESTSVERENRSRKDNLKTSEKNVSRRNSDDDSSKRRENDSGYNERNNIHDRYEEKRGYHRNGVSGLGRHEEGRRNSFEEGLAERNRRTVFIGNIPLSIKSTKHLLEILNVDNSLVEEARIRLPKGFRYESESSRTEKKAGQKAYITLKDEKDVKLLLEKNGVTCEGSELIVDMVIHSKHYDREKTVIVKSLNFRVTEGQLCDMFSPFGRVKGYRLIRDRRTNKSLGYGFIYFENEESVEKAIKAMNGKRVHDRPIIVSSMEHDSGHRRGHWSRFGGGRRYYDYRVRKNINKRDVSYRTK